MSKMHKADHNYSVLILEDDIDLATQWVVSLQDKGLTVQHALSVDEVEVYCTQKEYDLIIIDVFLLDNTGELIPRAGYTLLSYLRNSSLEKMPKWGATVPVIVVTGSAVRYGFDSLTYAKGMGANETMRKPINPELLYEKIMELIKDYRLNGKV